MRATPRNYGREHRGGSDCSKHADLPPVWHRQERIDAARCVPVLLRVHWLPRRFKAETGRLLRVLQFRRRPVPAEATRRTVLPIVGPLPS